MFVKELLSYAVGLAPHDINVVKWRRTEDAQTGGDNDSDYYCQ